MNVLITNFDQLHVKIFLILFEYTLIDFIGVLDEFIETETISLRILLNIVNCLCKEDILTLFLANLILQQLQQAFSNSQFIL